MKNEMRLVANSTILSFVKIETHQMNSLADWLYDPECRELLDDFDEAVDKIRIRVQALRDINILYDDEIEKLMEAYCNYMRERAKVRE